MMSKMTNRVVVDSSIWVANLNVNDVWHKESGEILKALSNKQAILMVTGFIISEVVGKVRLRVKQEAAAKFYRNVRRLEKSGVLRVENVDRRMNEMAMDILDKYPDLKKLSFVDAVSAVLIKTKKASTIATFDGDFEEIGVKLFEV